MKRLKLSQNVHASHMLTLLFLTIIATACGGMSSLSPTQQFIQSPEPVSAGQGDGSFIVATSMQDLVANSALIMVGRVNRADNIINMARDINDVSKSDPDVFVVGQVYQVKVEQYIKGNGEHTIYIVQREGFLGPDIPKTGAEIEKAKTNENYVAPNIGDRYLMFLRPLAGFSEQQYYVGVAHPWRFNVSDPEKVYPESPWKEAYKIFGQQSLSDIIMQIEYPDKFISPPYPPPGNLEIRPTAELRPYP